MVGRQRSYHIVVEVSSEGEPLSPAELRLLWEILTREEVSDDDASS